MIKVDETDPVGGEWNIFVIWLGMQVMVIDSVVSCLKGFKGFKFERMQKRLKTYKFSFENQRKNTELFKKVQIL